MNSTKTKTRKHDADLAGDALRLARRHQESDDIGERALGAEIERIARRYVK